MVGILGFVEGFRAAGEFHVLVEEFRVIGEFQVGRAEGDFAEQNPSVLATDINGDG